jgi:hypothetical protein
VVVWTLRSFIAYFVVCGEGALLCSIVPRVVLHFFPAVTLLTVEFIGTAFFVLGYVAVWLPIRTRERLVGIVLRLSSVVLPVVVVDAVRFIVLDEIERTVDGFIVKDVEIFIVGVVFDEIDFNVFFGVCEGAVDAVLATRAVVRVPGAELRFVLVFAVEFFDFIVCFRAGVAFGTVCNVRAHVRIGTDAEAASVLEGVVVLALLVIMVIRVGAGFDFKICQFEMLD